MRILVLATDYPNNDGGVTLMYIHARNKYYVNNGIDVTVLNFSAKAKYVYEGISVIPLESYNSATNEYDALVVHAANIRNHYRFLKKYGDKFPRFIFFFHGHEVLKVRETYSKPYSYVKNRSIQNSVIQECYDLFKLSVWRKYYHSVQNKSQFIFVSGWMKDKFEKYVKLNTKMYKTYIIPNNVGNVFEEQVYDYKCQKEYDFVTIRGNLDGSKYCIDFVNELAKMNPDLKFLVIGKGDFFNFNEKADNITWINKGLPQNEIPSFLNKARCALMPTRLDAQGVMMCEMATYGIPLITSNIDICREIQAELNNVILIENNVLINLKPYLEKVSLLYGLDKNRRFYAESTVGKEVQIINESIN